VGTTVGDPGTTLGLLLGFSVGKCDEGEPVGEKLGNSVGDEDGLSVGTSVGDTDGSLVGYALAAKEGLCVGDKEGLLVFRTVGFGVGSGVGGVDIGSSDMPRLNSSIEGRGE